MSDRPQAKRLARAIRLARRAAASSGLRRALRRAALALLALLLALVWWLWTSSPISRADFVRPDDALTIVDRNGATLRHARSEGVDRRWVELEDVSPHLIDAVLSVEDSRFREHGGVDLWALCRALTVNLLPGRRLSGASTITMQVVKLVYGRPHGLWSKPSELVRALRLERLLSKDQILEQYLNRLPFGDQIEGVQRASEEYFGVPASELTVGQAALLAGIPQAPSVTEPRRHLQRALARRRFVLHRMRVTGRIDDTTYREALAETPRIVGVEARPYRAPRYVDGALREWRRGNLERDGSVLRTSLDLTLQEEAEVILRRAVDGLEGRGVRQGAAIAVANATGEILAYVGAARRGADQPAGQMDIVEAARQPGSTLKPFVYELLFEDGGTAATILDDVQRPMTGAGEVLFEAEDYDGLERGPVRARVALASSLNLAALDAARRVGPHRIVARLRALGVHRLDEPDHYGAAIVLGGADVTAGELASAYVTLARGGTRLPLSFSPGGGAERPRRVLDRGASAIVADILRDREARADAFGDDLARLIDVTDGVFGLKTGTSSGWHDAWAAVFTELVTVVVWLGDPDGHPLDALSGFEGAAEPAVRILAAAHERARALGLSTPDAMAMTSDDSDDEPVALTTARICADSGLLAGDHCRRTFDERFLRGTLPARRCTQHDESGAWLLPHRYAGWLSRARPAGVAIPEDLELHPDAVVRVVHPRPGARLLLDPTRGATQIPLRAEVQGSAPPSVSWEVDGRPLDGRYWTASPGRHSVVAIVQDRRSEPVELEVRTPTDG